MSPNALPSQVVTLNGSLLEHEYERLLQWQDLVIRALRNPKMSPVYRDLYIALFDTYPQALDGQAVLIEPWRIRENAGWASEASATKFFQDFQSIGAFQYDPGKYDGKAGKRPALLTPNPDIFPYPETFDTKSTDRRRKARETEEKRRKQFKNPRQLLTCEECGSEDIHYDLSPFCNACGHEHATIKDVPAKDIVIEAEIVEIVDDFQAFFDDQATAKMPAIRPARPAPVQISLPVTPIPDPATRFGKHSRGIACPDCQAREHWYTVEADWGGIIEYCGICLPPQD